MLGRGVESGAGPVSKAVLIPPGVCGEKAFTYDLDKSSDIGVTVILKQTNGIYWLQFPALLSAKGVWHGIFLRMGGVSPAPFDTLNVGGASDDAQKHIGENRTLITDLLPPGRLHVARQTHGIQILRVPNLTDTADSKISLYGDAMVSRSKNQYLLIQVADCQAVLLIDPIEAVVANVHSGWRGSIENIVGRTLAAMVEQYGCRPERMLAGVGPSLGPCCAEFKHYDKEIPRKFWSYKDNQDHFDFWSITRDQLMAAGVTRSNIHISHICTRCNPHLFYSYRAQGRTGRFAAVIGLI